MTFDNQNQLSLQASAQAAARKTCTKCKATKSTSEFNRRLKADDGLQSWCRLCTIEAARAYNKKKRSKLKRSEAQKRRYAEAAKADPVNSPEHYKTGGIECIDAMIQVFGEDAVRTYARINAFKYQWRHRYKGKPEEDLAKAAWYTRFADGDDPRKGGTR